MSERAQCFSHSPAFLLLSFPSVYYPVCSFPSFSWQVLMMGPMCLSLLCPVLLRIMVLLMVLALISTEWVTAQSMHSSKSSEIFCYHSRVDSQILTTTSRPSAVPWVWSPPELPVLNKLSLPSLPRWRCLQHWNRTSALLQKMSTLSLNAYAKLKRMQRPSPVVPTRHDHGTCLDRVTAPQPLGPMDRSSDDSRNTRRRL